MPKLRYRLDGGAWIEVDTALPYSIPATAAQAVDLEPIGTLVTETAIAVDVAPTITASASLAGRTLTVTVATLTGTPAPSVSLSTLTLNGSNVLGDTTGTGPWAYEVPDSLVSQTVAWTVTATNSEGLDTSSGSETVAANLTPSTVPAQMSAPALTGGDESATLTLATPAPDDGGSTITLYTWEVDAAAGDFSSPVLAGSQSPGGLGNPIDISPLTAGGYKARSWAVNAEGSGDPSAASSEATVTSTTVDPSITSATFTAPTSSTNPQLTVDVDYAGTDDLELVIETRETVGGAAIETLTQSPYTSGTQFSLTTNATSDSDATVLHITVQEANNGGVSTPEVIDNISLTYTAPAASSDTFTAAQVGTTSAPFIVTTGDYPGGGFSLRFVMKDDAPKRVRVFDEDNITDEFWVEVRPNRGRLFIESKNVDTSTTMFSEKVTTDIAMPSDGNGFVEVLIHFINDPASTVASPTNQVEVYVNGSAYDPTGVYFANTNWLNTGDNRSRDYAFFPDNGSSFSRGPGDFADVEMWWGTDTGSGPTKPAAAPHLRVVGDAAGPFTSPHGGNYRVFDNGVERTV